VGKDPLTGWTASGVGKAPVTGTAEATLTGKVVAGLTACTDGKGIGVGIEAAVQPATHFTISGAGVTKD
jgi:hypothetical protein